MKEAIIGRTAEKVELKKIFESGKAEFLAIYGRRRVGKTFLIKEFFENDIVFSVTGLAKGNTRLQIKNFYYEKHIVMRSEQKSTPINQEDTDLLLRSTSHNNNHFLSPLSQSRRFLLDFQDLSESRLGVRFVYAFSNASCFAFESARA